ncbi:MAG: BamA/TamA family outer membrane protein [Flavobacterium sp.]|nr:BamA/TamA family outer membrane protein [Flavobacterium sp.]
MKKFCLLILLLIGFSDISAQQLHLKIKGSSEKETKTIDSISYNSTHSDLKSINTEVGNISEKLTRLGFIENDIRASEKTNDTLYTTTFLLGNKTKSIHIYIGKDLQKKTAGILNFKKDTLAIAFAETETFLNGTLNELERKGYSLAKLRLDNFRKVKNSLYAELKLDLGLKRQVNDIVINGYDKFPEGHKANIKRMYRNKVFNQENLKKIHDNFEQFRFVRQTKYPEILFTKDTTKVYVYLEKAKPNKFEGFVGFSNNENTNVKLNGYLDLLLVNALNSGEEFTLYWKSDGNDQKTFNVGLELPYVFKSRFGLKTALNIFKQDSTFQNTKTAIDIGYYFNYNTRLYLGYQATESSDIQNQNSSSISDFTNAYLTSHFEFLDFNTDDFLFPEKTRILLRAGIGKRDSKLDTNNQYFLNFDIKHAIYLSEKSSLNLQTQNYYLKSDQYIINELFRFGGINSIRGFNENSLQANLFTSLLTEYRYKITPSLYAHTILDYAHFNDKTNNLSRNLLGLGVGFGILTKNGLLHIIYANGSANHQQIKLSNSIVHISFKTNF